LPKQEGDGEAARMQAKKRYFPQHKYQKQFKKNTCTGRETVRGPMKRYYGKT